MVLANIFTAIGEIRGWVLVNRLANMDRWAINRAVGLERFLVRGGFFTILARSLK